VTADGYTLLRRLGQGGMAETFVARRALRGITQQVVVKRVLPHLAGDALFRSLFLDEARLCAQLAHPNIAQLVDFGEMDDQLFMALEHVDGVDLEELQDEIAARGAAMPPAVAARVACFVCEALAYAHARVDERGAPLGIVHRDVSPSNVIVTPTAW
jgi:eukaryotic-like serine/threonine-protein kinase